MRSPSCLVLLLALILCSSPLTAAEHLTYRGTFAPVKDVEGNDSQKVFELQAIELGSGPTREAFWTLEESGRGAWPWTERFGVAPQAPTLLDQRSDGFAVIPLPETHFGDAPLSKDSVIKQGKLTYRVVGSERVADLDCWQLEGSDDFGPRRSLLVVEDGALVVAGEAKVFVGQGIDCRLRWELTGKKSIEDSTAQKWFAQASSLAKLRDQAGWQAQSRELKWKPGQITLLQTGLPELKKQTTSGPLAAIVDAAQQDATTQNSRGDALTAVKNKALGQAVGKFALATISGGTVTETDLNDHVTVLHFWDYHDSPLEEPYGQVGYLDFLARQTAKSGVKVYGVMVDDRLAERDTRAQALSSARKVQSFMNLSYPILLDEAGLLKKIGDPRSTGAKLPLWVVIGKDGKVLHYHVGFYDVRRDQGLSELAEVLGK